jgi:D-threo-aldose 1-dehydrogenase
VRGPLGFKIVCHRAAATTSGAVLGNPAQAFKAIENFMNPRSRLRVGKSKLQITRLGLGGAALGGLYSDTANNTVQRALQLGVPFFDTAPLYGAGKSESRLGRALAGCDRDLYILASKVGYALLPQEAVGDPSMFFPFDNPPPLRPVFDFSYDAVMRSVEESLVRLGTNRIDIVYIHDPDKHFHEAMNGAYVALNKLKQERVVGALGVGTTSAETLIRMVEAGQFDCVLLAGRYTLIDHTALTQALPLCVQKSVSVIIGGPYSSGILATGAVAGATHDYLPAAGDILQKVGQIEDSCRKYSVPLKAAALQFPLAHPAVVSIIPGARTAGEVEENFRMAEHSIPAEFWADLRSRGLLPEEAPVPLAAHTADSQLP